MKKKMKKIKMKKKMKKIKMNSIKNEISQRMILDKKEIEEMLKNELNFGSPINNENKQEENKITSLNGQYKDLNRNE